MFEGDLDNGELEKLGRFPAIINNIKPVSEIMSSIIEEYKLILSNLKSYQL